MTGNDFRLYAGVDFSREFLCHYDVGHDRGGHSGRYPWGSGDRPKQDLEVPNKDRGPENSTSESDNQLPSTRKKKGIPQEYKDAVKRGAKIAAGLLIAYGAKKISENDSLIEAGQSIFDDVQVVFDTGSDLFSRVFKKNKEAKINTDNVQIISDVVKKRKYDFSDKNAFLNECINANQDIIKALSEQKKGFNPVNKSLAEAIISDFNNIIRSRRGFTSQKDISNLIFTYEQTLNRIQKPENRKYSSDFTQELLKTAIEDLKDVLQNFYED